MVQARQICRHLVGDAPREIDLGERAEAWRQHRQCEALYGFRGEIRLRRRAGRRLEQGLGRRLDRERRQVQLHRGLSRFRHRRDRPLRRSEEHTSELQSLMRISYAVFCLKKKISHNIYPHSQTASTETNISNTLTL